VTVRAVVRGCLIGALAFGFFVAACVDGTTPDCTNAALCAPSGASTPTAADAGEAGT